MKITYVKADTIEDITIKFIANDSCFFYTIQESIMSTDFKKLARMSRKYDAKRKTGFIAKSDEKEFLSLVSKIENTDSTKAKKSHQKSIEKHISRKNIAKCDHSDLSSLGYRHGEKVKCPCCGSSATVW